MNDRLTIIRGDARKALLIELNPEYCKLIERRCDVTPGLPL